MQRAVLCRLRLELCEERWLPSGLAINSDPHTSAHSTTQTSTMNRPDERASSSGDSEDDDSEYADKGTTTKTPDASEYNSPPISKNGPLPETSAEYALAIGKSYLYVSAPPMPKPASSSPAPVPLAVSAADIRVPGNLVNPLLQVPPQYQSEPVIATAAPEVNESSDEWPAPRSVTDGQPAVPEPEIQVEVAPIGAPQVEEIDLHVDFSGWAKHRGAIG